MRVSCRLVLSFQRLIMTAWAIMALVTLQPCTSQPLSDDSTRFAGYWELVEAGDTTGAGEYLLSLTDARQGRTSPLAGFLLGWLAYQREDYAGVEVQLGLGVPPELTDHALFLRADALERLGQAERAASLWEELARDTSSVYMPEALFRLAEWARATGNTSEFLDWAAKHRNRSTNTENRQQLDLMAAEILASQNRHAESVDILYNAVLAGPATEAAEKIRQRIHEYPKRFHVTPRRLTAEEIHRELDALESTRSFQSGLHRVHEWMQSPQGGDLSERLTYFQARFENGLGRHRKAVESFRNYLRRFPDGPFRGRALYYLGRSAYFTDQDSIAIGALAEAADGTDDLILAQQALELLGLLYLERGRPGEAEAVFRRWETLSRGSDSELDCLWRLGWAQWEGASFEGAAETWRRLFEQDSMSAYAPIALYWQSRASQRMGRAEQAEERRQSLRFRFPYSYYTVTEFGTAGDIAAQEVPLTAPTLDALWLAGGQHAKRFCLLAAMRLPRLALEEWPAMRREVSSADGLAWWEAQLHIWNGNRRAAMRVIRRDLAVYIATAGQRPSGFYSTLYPLDFDPKIIQQAAQYDIDPYFLFALICQESHFDPSAISPAGAIGLMQLMPETARIEAREQGISYSAQLLADPDYNLKLGIAHVARLWQLYSGDPVLTLAAYNAGKNKANEWQAKFPARDRDEFIELIPYRETRMFIKRILEHRAAYRRLYPDVGSSLIATPTPSKTTE
ncbi:MAG: transglycosylase SLT domain-containing protein [bacterium]|nr:transglycosylase SLT domain-containing protein [bacterium]